jgi:YD repeat-containing protein
MILTKELLHQYSACKDGINFCERNQLFGFDLEQIGSITGDYRNFISWIRKNLIQIRFVYDNRGNKIKSIDPYGRYSSWKYDNNNNIIEYTDIGGRVCTYTYDENNNRIGIYRLGEIITHQYDDRGNKIKTSRSNGTETYYEYDDRNNNIFVRSNFTIGSLVEEQWSKYEYDERNNVIRKDNNHGEWIVYTYDDRNNKIKEQHSDNTWYLSNFDENNYRIMYSDYTGCMLRAWYDEHGNITSEQDEQLRNYEYTVEYYDDGQLKQYDELCIPKIGETSLLGYDDVLCIPIIGEY